MSRPFRRAGARQSIRARLAARYAVVAFVTGALLLSFSYVVVRHELTPKAEPGLMSYRIGPSAPLTAPDRSSLAMPTAIGLTAVGRTAVSPLTSDPLDLGWQTTNAATATARSFPAVAAKLAASTQRTVVVTPTLPAVPALQTDEVAATPVTRDTTIKVLQAVQIRDQQVLRTVLLAFSGALLLMTLISAWIGWLLAGRALAPVARITAAARGVTQRNLHERIALGGPHDELRELADTFDTMLDKLDVAFESERQFVANASHELRTPLTVVRAAIDVAEDAGPLDDETRAMTGTIRRALTRADQLVERLLTLARSDRGIDARVPVPFDRIVEETAEERLGGGRAGDLDVRLDVAPDLTVAGDPVLLGTLVGNLLDNAVLYNRPAGRVAVTVASEDDDEAVVLRVENDGAAVPEASLDGLLRPFQRAAGRAGHGGFGLGLSIVESIARAHGGAVRLRTRAEGGLTVTVSLPRTAARPTRELVGARSG